MTKTSTRRKRATKRPPPRDTARFQKPELLAPAGHVEAFWAAVESGADAVYLGLKQLSARAHAANFSLKEVSRLLPFARSRHVSVYVAMNSTVTAPEVPQVLDTLQALSDLGVDALIVQDPGLFFLCRRFFPHLKLHASTLAAVHNRAGVRTLKRLGARRVVLARELGLEELRDITRSADVELEIFVHGALCFSFSGLCLASSFRGGHSGLQGRCVQPCRLRFRQGRKQGYFFSCGDFSALPRLPELMELGIASFKIEGRMKDADYIATVVQAYRQVLDAPAAGRREAIRKATEQLALSPARRLTDGFLGAAPSETILSPHRSGSSGLWVGTVVKAEGHRLVVNLRRSVQAGDRLRPESAEGREKAPFLVQAVQSLSGDPLDPTPPQGPAVVVAAKASAVEGERLFRIGRRPTSPAEIWKRIRREGQEPFTFSKAFQAEAWIPEEAADRGPKARRLAETLVLKVGRHQDLSRALQSPAQWIFCTATKENLERLAKGRLHPAQKKRFGWSLPPVVLEKDEEYYRKAVAWFAARGYRIWEVNNWGHWDWLEGLEGLHLWAGSRMNIRNKAAMAALADMGCTHTVLSQEVTGGELRELIADPVPAIPVVTVYGQPFLFISRLQPAIMTGVPVRTARGDQYMVERQGALTTVFADHPFCWFEKLPELRAMGYRLFLIDLSEGGARLNDKDWQRILSGFRRHRADAPYSLFNYERKAIPEGKAKREKG
ncbi:putative protease [Desulfacinum hydrothermale DSM 13146]|uniref:Putative protease n=1 Tax=Desulfacinum hydrothermale DSM 13146 TaxID=1121390 RepID=A0A1W1XM61_9BACT|nr:peptidase U32 family protein [Desulfacinum hydrothermale]SMC24618.1 putative protease [Desulfacinum hydrothermale DSM 13146]